MDVAIISKCDSPSFGMTCHNSRPNRIRRKAEAEHFEGIPLLTTLGAFNVMEVAFVVGIPQVACMLMNCPKIGKEISNFREERYSVTHLDLP